MLRAGLARTHLLGFGGRTSEGRSSPLPLTPWEKDTSQTTLAQDLLVLRGEPLAGASVHSGHNLSSEPKCPILGLHSPHPVLCTTGSDWS